MNNVLDGVQVTGTVMMAIELRSVFCIEIVYTVQQSLLHPE